MVDFRIEFFHPQNVDPQELFPFLYTRKGQELIVGSWSLSEKIHRALEIFEHDHKKKLAGLCGFSQYVFLSFDAITQIFQSTKNTLWRLSDRTPIAYFAKESIVPADFLESLGDAGASFWEEEKYLSPNDGFVFSSIAGILEKQEDCLLQDLQWMNENSFFQTSSTRSGKIGHSRAKIHPTAVLEEEHGPIYLEDGVEVGALSYIEGPCFIGAGTKILQAKIRSSYIGKDCRIGGEVSHSVIDSYTNKAHDGYIGHSYLGSWVNLGALCTTSDLKNNYQAVSLTYGGKTQSTTLLKMGSVIGDFSMLSIGTLLNTGTVIGIGCNIADPNGFLPKDIPSFTWKTQNGVSTYRWGSFVESLKIRMQRRKKNLSPEDERALKTVYNSMFPIGER